MKIQIRIKNTIVEDREISLMTIKDSMQIHFLHIGYNFNYRIERINKYDLPISYSIIDKTWGLDDMRSSPYIVKQKRKAYDPANIYMLFADSLDFSEMERYGRRGIKKLVINKVNAEYYKKQGSYYYFFNNDKKVIFVEEVKNVINPEKVIKDINKLLFLIYN